MEKKNRPPNGLFTMDVVRENPDYFAKEFAEGSLALESLLKSMWSHGIDTIGCCNGCRMDFSEDDRRLLKWNLDQLKNAHGIKRLFMALQQPDIQRTDDAYLSVETKSIANPNEFKKIIEQEMAPFKRESKFRLYESANGRIGISFTLPREKPFKWSEMLAKTKEEALKIMNPSPATFDKYFAAVESGFKKYCVQFQNKYIPLGSITEKNNMQKTGIKLHPPLDKQITAAEVKRQAQMSDRTQQRTPIRRPSGRE